MPTAERESHLQDSNIVCSGGDRCSVGRNVERDDGFIGPESHKSPPKSKMQPVTMQSRTSLSFTHSHSCMEQKRMGTVVHIIAGDPRVNLTDCKEWG
jgi:hypothetical protein